MTITIGSRFGKLIVKSLSPTKKGYVICTCDCGTTKEIKISSLQRKHNPTQSCGCKHREAVSHNGKTTITANSKEQLLLNRRFNTNFQMIESHTPPKNNTSGIKGVTWNKNHKKWEAYISIHGKRKYLGNYDYLAEAQQARQLAEEKYFTPLIRQKKRLENNNINMRFSKMVEKAPKI